MVARGVSPESIAFSSDIRRTQADPSLIPEALPAVTVPSFLKAGFSFARVSFVVPNLGTHPYQREQARL